jgi:diguanylate cyclase (GGDEF)-like protein
MEPLSLLLPVGFSAVSPSILALCLVAWVVILRRRARFRTEKTASNSAFARDRNGIIDSFARDESLDAILNRVCALVEVYLPGSTCRIELIREGGVAREDPVEGIPVLALDGKTVAVMRVEGQENTEENSVLLEEIRRLTAQAVEQRRVYDRLLRQSPQGMLEGIVDRVLLDQRLDAALSRARIHGHEVALIHVGLESFEDINELLGAGAAEIVLHCAAFRLLACTRPSDHVARIGRDEFSVILTELHNRASAEEVARRIVKSLDAPIGVEHANIHVGAAVGICLFPDQAADPGEMQRRAHLAMYAAKAGSESQYVFYRDEAEEPSPTDNLLVLSAAVVRNPTESSGHPLDWV